MDRQFKKQTDQFSPFSFFSSWLLSVTMLTPFMVFTCFLIFGFSLPFITIITFLILSTSILISTKNRRLYSSAQDPAPEVQVAKKSQLTAAAETIDENPESKFENREAQKEHQLQNQFSGSGGHVESQNLGVKWVTPDVDLDQTEDEEEDDELIEIELHGWCDKNADLILDEEAKQVTFGKYMAAEAILKHQYLIELFAEMNEGNEEENLIEIDISMGSIKCPSFEIQA